MDVNSLTTTIISTINTLIEQLLGSIDNNLYTTLDNITFINSDILKNNNFEQILGTSTTTGILLIANSLLLRNYYLFWNKIFNITFYLYRNGVSKTIYF